MINRIVKLSKKISTFKQLKKSLKFAFSNPIKFYKYLKRTGSDKWILFFFSNYKQYELFIDEINNSKLVDYLRSSLTLKFCEISGTTNRGDPFISGIIKENHAFDIYSLIRILKPSIVVETGVCNGFSSTIILEALKNNSKGHLYSIDYPEFADNRHDKDEFWTGKKGAVVPKDEESGWLVPHNLRDRWTLIIGKTRNELLPLLNKLKGVDIFLHDSEHSYENQMFEFKTAFSYLNDEGILIASDINWNNSYEDFLSEVKNRSKNFFLDYDFGIIKKIKFLR